MAPLPERVACSHATSQRSGTCCPNTLSPRLSLNAAIGFDRRALVVRERMDDLRRAQRLFGVTLNDLLLTAVAAGVHDLLSSRVR